MKKIKIAVITPVFYEGGTFRLSKMMAKMLKKASNEEVEIEVIFANPQSKYTSSDLKDLTELGIKIREFNWQTIPQGEACQLYSMLPGKVCYEAPEYYLPSDGGNQFFDCDLWLFTCDRIKRPLLPIKKTVIVANDFIQRYVPEIFPKDQYTDLTSDHFTYLRNMRNCDYCLASTIETNNDLRVYGGRSSGAIPFNATIEDDLFELASLSLGSSPVEDPYFHWVTNGTGHKNHIRALTALDQYYRHHNGKLKVVMTGVHTQYFSPALADKRPGSEHDHYYHRQVREIIRNNPVLNSNIIIPGNVSDIEYATYLKNARFLFHNVLADNGTYSVIEAALLGVPALSSYYPQQVEVNERFDLRMNFFDPFDPYDCAQKLFLMESGITKRPLDISKIRKYSWRNYAPEFAKNILNLVFAPRIERKWFF